MIPKRITAKWLVEHGACGREVLRFRRLYPNGAAVTYAALLRAEDQRFTLSWLDGHLSASQRRAIQRHYATVQETKTCCVEALARVLGLKGAKAEVKRKAGVTA